MPELMNAEELALRMKQEILADIAAGIVPATVRIFSELHDYVDANCYGGTEALLEQLDAAGPDTDEAHQANLNSLCDLMGAAMEIVNVWLKNGRMDGCPRSPEVRR